jgi:hypothetical protein
MDQVKCNPCTKWLKLTQSQSKKTDKGTESYGLLSMNFLNIFSQQIANDSGEHPLSDAVQLASKIPQFQRESKQKYLPIRMCPFKISLKR